VSRRLRLALAMGLAVLAAAPSAAEAAGFIIAGSRNGSGFGLVRVFADNDNNNTYETLVEEFVPYASPVPGGVRVASGDFDGDGNDELVTASSENAPVKIYELGPSGAPGALVDSRPGFTEGTNVAAGDLNGDGRAELIMGADPGGEPRVRIHADANADGVLDAAIDGFNAYPATNDGGVRVAAANTDNDSFPVTDELIVGPGPDPGLPVKIYDDTDLDRKVSDNPIDDSFVPYDAGFGGGTYVAAAPMEGAGGGGAEVIVSPASGQNRKVIVRTDTDGDGDVSDHPPFEQLPPPYGASFASGVRVAAGDTDHSGVFVEVITAPGADAGSKPVRVYDDNADPGFAISDNPLDDSFGAFPGNVGVFVAFARAREAVYSDTDTPLPIPDGDAAPLQAEIRVPRSAGIARDVDVFLNIRHTSNADLDVLLTHTSPDGVVFVKLFDDVPNNDDGFSVWLDDSDSTDIATVPDDPNDRPVTGIFNLEDPYLLSTFNARDASGRWTLTVEDDLATNVGSLQQWSLRIGY
jgi:subtilisin-like proprotein convertase family protein